MYFYSVAVGRKTGIFLNWSDCAESVKDYSGAIFHKWGELREATQHLNTYGFKQEESAYHVVKHGIMTVHTADGKTMSVRDYCTQQGLLIPAEVGYIHRPLFNIGHSLFIEVGEETIDIHHQDFDTKERKNGITLDYDEWRGFLELADELFATLERVKNSKEVKRSDNLCRDIYVTVNSPYPVINIRHWYEKNGTLRPTKNGMTVRKDELVHFLHLQEQIELCCAYNRYHHM